MKLSLLNCMMPNSAAALAVVLHTRSAHGGDGLPALRKSISGLPALRKSIIVSILSYLKPTDPILWKGHRDHVTAVDVTPDGTLIVSASCDLFIKIWDRKGECKQTLVGHTHFVNAVVVTQDGHRIISASTDKTLKIWSIHDGACIRTLMGHTSSVNSVVLFPDGKRLVSGSWDKTIKLWNIDNIGNIDTGECEQTITVPEKCVAGCSYMVELVCVSSDGKQLASISMGGTIIVWNALTLDRLNTFTDRKHRKIVFSNNNKLVVGLRDHTLKIFDITTGVCEKILRGHTGQVSALFCYKEWILSGSDTITRIWNSDTGECKRTIIGPHTGESWAMVVSPNGTIVVGSTNGEVVLI